MTFETQLLLTGITGLVAIVACWSFAIVLFRVSAIGSVPRRLAVLLVIEGFVLITAGFPEMFMNISPDIYDQHPVFAFLSGAVHHMGDSAMIALYPPFLALALDTRLTRRFSDQRARMILAVGAALLGLTVVVFPAPTTYVLLYSTVTVVFIYAFIASIHAWRTEKSDKLRRRAGIFALAFGFRDLCWSLSYATAAWFMWTEVNPMDATYQFLGGKFVYALGTLFAIPLIAYGILSAHLFDIDLRIRWTIKQSTVGIAVFAIIFIVSEGAESLLSEQLGNYWGILAAAVIAIALRPLQGFAERVSAAAMPNTKDTPEYKADRKRQVYESALGDALQDGSMSDRERTLLNHLRDSLGISVDEAEKLERKLQPIS